MIRIKLKAGEAPSEFQIFQRGVNRTTKGNFNFDDAAAKAVMSKYRQHGVDLMIDLEHLSLDEESNAFDPDARGWCQLELRKDGSLWAVNVRWTPEGAERLQKRTQRYISPVFTVADNRRILSVINIAICAMPATYNAPALVAASKRVGAKVCATALKVESMDPLLKKIAERLGMGEDATAEDILAALDALIAKAKDAEPAASDDADPDAEEMSDDEEPADDEALSVDPKELVGLKPEVQAKVLALASRQSATEKRLAKLERNQATSETEELIKANTAKLTPALEKWARTVSASVLRTFLKAAPGAARPRTEPVREGGQGEGAAVELTPAEIEAVTLLKVKPEDLKAYKLKLAEKAKERRRG